MFTMDIFSNKFFSVRLLTAIMVAGAIFVIGLLLVRINPVWWWYHVPFLQNYVLPLQPLNNQIGTPATEETLMWMKGDVIGWLIEYPSSWQLSARPHGGAFFVQGEYHRATFEITGDYSPDLGGYNAGYSSDLNVDGWVRHVISTFSDERRKDFVLKRVSVASVPAIEVIDSKGLTATAYIWKEPFSDTSSGQRVITIKQVSGSDDPVGRVFLFERFLKGLK